MRKALRGQRLSAEEAAETSTPEGRKSSGNNGVLEASGELLGGSWAPDGCQDRSGGAPGELLAAGEGLREAFLVLL